jgi:proteasome activator subunit 4
MESTYSERGWAWAGKIYEKSISCLTSVFFSDTRMLNKDDWESEGEYHAIG